MDDSKGAQSADLDAMMRLQPNKACTRPPSAWVYVGDLQET